MDKRKGVRLVFTTMLATNPIIGRGWAARFGAGVGVGTSSGAGSTSDCKAAAPRHPASLHAGTRATQMLWSFTVMTVSDDVEPMP